MTLGGVRLAIVFKNRLDEAAAAAESEVRILVEDADTIGTTVQPRQLPSAPDQSPCIAECSRARRSGQLE